MDASYPKEYANVGDSLKHHLIMRCIVQVIIYTYKLITIRLFSIESIKPHNSSIFSTPTNNMYSSIFVMPTETASLSINTIQTESHTSTLMSSPPIPVLILNTSSLHQSTFSVNDIKPSSTSEPTNSKLICIYILSKI